MRLLIIIVQEVDYPRLSDAFVAHEIRATKFLTEGLYLNKKNITLMVCIQEDRLEEVFGYIRESCTERIEERRFPSTTDSISWTWCGASRSAAPRYLTSA